MKIAGVDVGTTGCKCTVFDETGKYLNKAYRDYPIHRNASGHEFDMEVLWESVCEVISEMVSEYPDIAGIGVTSFGETFVLTDEAGIPLHKAMLYTDPRGHEECQEVIDRLGEMRIAEVTGLRPHEMYGLPKLLWIKKNMPEVYTKAKHIFQVEDFLVFKLSGVAQIDYSLATRSMVFDVNTLEWNDEFMDTFGIDKSIYPKVVPTGTTAGKVNPEIADRIGLNKECIIVSISQDQVAAAVGAGAFGSDVAVDGAGTVECMTPIFDSKPDVESMYSGYYAIVPYVIPGRFVTYAFSYTGGALTQWCTSTLTKYEKEEAQKAGVSVNEYLEKEYMEKHGGMMEPSGLLVLPHFAGAATPYMDTGSRGVIVGLNTETSASDIYIGCLEGVVYEMYLNYNRLPAEDVHFTRIHATGGGAKSAIWMQMKADMLNLPIVALKTVDAGTVGSAMLTGVAIGVFSNLDDAAKNMVEETVTYYPRADMHEKYLKVYERYERLYEAVRPVI